MIKRSSLRKPGFLDFTKSKTFALLKSDEETRQNIMQKKKYEIMFQNFLNRGKDIKDIKL